MMQHYFAVENPNRNLIGAFSIVSNKLDYIWVGYSISPTENSLKFWLHYLTFRRDLNNIYIIFLDWEILNQKNK